MNAMNKQPEALRWAAILEHQAKYDGANDYKHKASAELRRLHEENKQLRLAVAEEREACARIVEQEALAYAEPVWAVEIVTDIRARGEA